MPRGPRSLRISDGLRVQVQAFKGDEKDSWVCDRLGISQQTLTRIMSGRPLRLSERVLRRIAEVLQSPVASLTAEPVEQVPSPQRAAEAQQNSRSSLGRALLAAARGDHRQALDDLRRLEPAALDAFDSVAYRIALARAYSGLGELEPAERLLREAVSSLEQTNQNLLLVARVVFELAVILARREKTLDAIETFVFAERAMERVGRGGEPFLFLVRQYHLGVALKVGHWEHAARLLRDARGLARMVEGEGAEGVALLDELLLDAIAPS